MEWDAYEVRGADGGMLRVDAGHETREPLQFFLPRITKDKRGKGVGPSHLMQCDS